MSEQVTQLNFADLTAYRISSFPLWHAFFSRNGGFSDTPYASLNAAWRTEDPAAPRNREKLLSASQLTDKPLRILNPCHGERIAVVVDTDWGADKDGVLIETDAAITRTPGTYFLMSTADCLPVLICNREQDLMALIHLGWRNIVAGFPSKVISTIEEMFGIPPTELLAAIGPSIYPCCYAFENPTQKQDPFWTPFLTDLADGKTAIDLVAATRKQLENAGMKTDAISDSALCTGCRNDTFFSCFKEGYKSGRFPTLVGLAPA